eukprot:6815863-Heterocapsa_arctica.AAC.1
MAKGVTIPAFACAISGTVAHVLISCLRRRETAKPKRTLRFAKLPSVTISPVNYMIVGHTKDC